MGRLGKILKVGCLAVVALMLLAMAGLAVFVWHVRRTAPPWPERVPGIRLEPSRPLLREADIKPDNAYYHIRQLNSWTNSLKFPHEEWKNYCALGYQTNEYPSLEALWMSNAAPVDICHKAAAMTNCQVATSFSLEHYAPYHGLVFSLSKLFCFQAGKAASAGDLPTAVALLRLPLILGEEISRGGPLINNVIGMNCGNFACREMRRFALSSHDLRGVLNAMMQLLHDREVNREPLDESLRFEWIELRTTTEHVLPQEYAKYSRNVFAAIQGTPEVTLTHFDALFSHLIADAGSASGHISFDVEMANEWGKLTKLQMLVRGDLIGRILFPVIMPAIGEVRDVSFAFLANLRGTQVFLAICTFRQEHGGQLPKTLEALVPAYLPQLPADPFAKDGQTFRYRIEKDRWLIWSLGPNLKDDGGHYNLLFPDDREKHKDEADIIFASDEFIKARERALAALEKSKGSSPARQ